MLLELRVENYAVIDNVAVEFASGLNLLTGETGAGKSILIDALALLLGEKPPATPSATAPRKPPSPRSSKSAPRPLTRVLEENGIDTEDGQIILRREIAAGGKGRVFINNQPATVTVLKQLAPHLAVIHAQNEAVLAFDAARAWRCWTPLPAVDDSPSRQLSTSWNEIRHRIADLERDEKGPPEAARSVELSAQGDCRRAASARRRREARGGEARAGQCRARSQCRHGRLRRAV